MKVKILYFGSLKEKFGQDEQEIELAHNMSVESLFCQVLGDDSHLKKLRDKLLYAVNQEQVSRDTIVDDGDEVAFMPPMAGG